jgi:predicted transcriptional regulator
MARRTKSKSSKVLAPQQVRTIEELRREVEIGLAQAEAGQLVDGPAVFRRLLARIRRGSET